MKSRKLGVSKVNREWSIPPGQAILGCLRNSSDPLRIGKIMEFLYKQYKIKFYDHKGILPYFVELMNEGLIQKNPKTKGRTYPTYEITTKGIRDIRTKANVFSIDGNKILALQDFHSWLPDSKKLEEMVKIIGVYTVFTHLKGKKLSLAKTKKTEQWEIENSWLVNCLPMNNVSFFIKQCFFTFLKDNESKKHKISELEEELKDIFPNECSQLEEVYNGLEKRIDDIKKVMREQKERQKRREKLNSK